MIPIWFPLPEFCGRSLRASGGRRLYYVDRWAGSAGLCGWTDREYRLMWMGRQEVQACVDGQTGSAGLRGWTDREYSLMWMDRQEVQAYVDRWAGSAGLCG